MLMLLSNCSEFGSRLIAFCFYRKKGENKRGKEPVAGIKFFKNNGGEAINPEPVKFSQHTRNALVAIQTVVCKKILCLCNLIAYFHCFNSKSCFANLKIDLD